MRQAPDIFEGTFESNIKYGSPDATVEQMHSAAKMADIHDFIMEQKEKYQAKVRDGGR